MGVQNADEESWKKSERRRGEEGVYIPEQCPGSECAGLALGPRNFHPLLGMT